MTPEAPDDAAAQAEAKRFATVQARLALRGYTLQRLDGGRFAVSRWDRDRVLDDLAAVEAFARQVGALHAA